jgi:uncharacterized membrane protein (DUF106 family)
MKYTFMCHDYNKVIKPGLGIPGTIKIKLLFLVGILIAGLFFAQLVFANNLATDGQKLSEVQQEMRRLERENMTLKADIAGESSLNTLSQKADILGFKKPSKVIDL